MSNKPPAVCAICGRPGTTTLLEQIICDECHQRILEYTDRVDARLERMRRRADKTRQAAQSNLKAAHDKASRIPFGQPILVGHHSEKRDRRYRDGIERTYRRGFAKLAKAEELEDRIDRAESDTSISSDDPAAVIKLRAKLAKREERQALMKKRNRIVRRIIKQYPDDREQQKQALAKALDLPVNQCEGLLEPDFAGRIGYPSYMLSNNNANIRRIRDRIASLEKRNAQMANGDLDYSQEKASNGIEIIRDPEDNRIRLVFPGKPSAAIRTNLKSNGFRWSRANMAWQRHLNNAGEHAVQRVLDFVSTQANITD